MNDVLMRSVSTVTLDAAGTFSVVIRWVLVTHLQERCEEAALNGSRNLFCRSREGKGWLAPLSETKAGPEGMGLCKLQPPARNWRGQTQAKNWVETPSQHTG